MSIYPAELALEALGASCEFLWAKHYAACGGAQPLSKPPAQLRDVDPCPRRVLDVVEEEEYRGFCVFEQVMEGLELFVAAWRVDEGDEPAP